MREAVVIGETDPRKTSILFYMQCAEKSLERQEKKRQGPRLGTLASHAYSTHSRHAQ